MNTRVELLEENVVSICIMVQKRFLTQLFSLIAIVVVGSVALFPQKLPVTRLDGGKILLRWGLLEPGIWDGDH